MNTAALAQACELVNNHIDEEQIMLDGTIVFMWDGPKSANICEGRCWKKNLLSLYEMT
jgi:hypothetical protein